MFKAARWRSEKNKIKVVFKLQFQATQVSLLGSETVMVSLVAQDVGRPTVRSEKVAVMDGTCNWLNPIYETVKLVRDPKSGKINEKLYQFLVSATGSNKPGLLGEVTVNLADYVEVFKAYSLSLPLKAGAILHVIIQRMQGDVADREADDNGDATVRQHTRTLQSQLSMSDNEKGLKALIGRNDMNLVKDVSRINREPRVRFLSSRNLPTSVDTNGKLPKSHSTDAISAASSDSSSEVYTPRQNHIKNGSIQKHCTRFLSHHTNIDVGFFPQKKNIDVGSKLITSSGYWSRNSAPDGSTDGSTNSSVESGLREGMQCSDDTREKLGNGIVFLMKNVETSDLESQNLREKIVKESGQGQHLLREISRLKEERDASRRECEEIKLSQKRTKFDENVSVGSQLAREDPLSMLEEIKQELDHEKILNSSLRLQLQKTQEANSELLLAVRDLDDLLEQQNKETSCHKCNKINDNGENDEFFRVVEFEKEVPHLQQSESKQDLPGNDKEQHALGAPVNEHNHMSLAYSLEKKITDLNRAVDLYKKDREDLELQIEQIALDYEILKQENHDLSSKLEQIQLREQLRVQYECSAHLSIINDLEAHVESLEKELQTQAESFESDVDTLTQAKVEQEKKAIQIEEALMKTKWKNGNTIERLHEEIKSLSSQVSSVFYANEKIVKQALKEASELQSQKSHLKKFLEKTKENLASVHDQYRMNLQQVLSLLVFKSKETDKMLLELKDKNEQLANYKKSEEASLKTTTEKVQSLNTEIDKLKTEKYLVSEERENLVTKMENFETRNTTNEMMPQDRNSARELLKEEIMLLKQKLEISLEEINDLRNMRDEKETVITLLNSEIEVLRLQFNDLKQLLSDGELEKENLRRLVFNFTGGLLKAEDMITISEGELGKNYTNGPIRSIHSLMQNLKDWRNEVKDVEDKHCHKSSMCDSRNRYQRDVDCQQRPREGDEIQINNNPGKDQELVSWCYRIDSEEKQQIVSCTCDQHKVAELLSEMAVLRRQNESTEAELKEMQERYSEISLKFAEVEGERQQLRMTVRALKNSLKH